MTPAQMFDGLAPNYDRLWTSASAGRLQREAFWQHAAMYFKSGARVLDVGCGTGEDAVRLMRSGMSVTAIDVSPSMIEIARSRGVDARVLAAEELYSVADRFDVVMSNFGALNCVANLSAIRASLANVVKPEGFAVFCVMNRFCLWETVWFLLRGKPSAAVRRWNGEAETTNGLRVCYPLIARVRRDLTPEFTLIAQFGIGTCVPPSYVCELPAKFLRFAAAVDSRISKKPVFRSMADHRVLVFRRNK